MYHEFVPHNHQVDGKLVFSLRLAGTLYSLFWKNMTDIRRSPPILFLKGSPLKNRGRASPRRRLFGPKPPECPGKCKKRPNNFDGRVFFAVFSETTQIPLENVFVFFSKLTFNEIWFHRSNFLHQNATITLSLGNRSLKGPKPQ